MAAPAKQKAFQTLRRNAQGRPELVYVDAAGKVIPYAQINNYEVVTAGNEYYSPTAPKEEKKKEPETKVKKLLKQEDSHPLGWNRETNKVDDLKGTSSGPADNWGYVNKPGIMGLTNHIPGALGMASKLVSTALNANNNEAMQQARDSMDVPEQSKGQQFKNTIKDQHGQIGDFKLNNGRTYAVGFEAMSPDGRTNLTPQEARMRSVGSITEETRQKAGGILSKGADIISNVVDTIFGDETKPMTKVEPQVRQDYGLPQFSNINNQMAEQREIRQSQTGAPVGQVERQPLGNVPQAPQISRNPYDTQRAQTQPQQGLGLAALAPRGLTYEHPNRGAWDANLTPEIKGVANRLSGTLDNMHVTSTYRDPDLNRAVGGAPKSAHISGNAFDVSTRGMTDDEKQKAVEMARLSGAKGIGNYADGSLHFDVANRGTYPNTFQNTIPTVDGTYGMYAKTANNAMTRAPDWFTKGMTQDRFAPTPTPRPDPQATAPNNPVAQSLDPLKSSSVFSQISPQEQPKSFAEKHLSQTVTPSDNRFAGKSVANMSPAEFAATGLTQRTPEERDRIAHALSGELSGEQLKSLQANDPVARQELANMVASVENRAASARFGSLDKALTGSQYNSIMTENLGTTNNNFSLYGDAVKTGVGDYYTGANAPSNYGHTSYYNPGLASPTWGSKMKQAENVGDHRFGVLNSQYDYGPGRAFLDERDRVAAGQVADTRGFTPERNYSGGYSNDRSLSTSNSRYDTPSERSGRGSRSSENTPSNKNYSGGGSSKNSNDRYDTPSERSGRGTSLSNRSSSERSSSSAGSNKGLNDRGNRSSGSGPMSEKNTRTSSSSSSSRSGSAQSEARDSRSRSSTKDHSSGGRNAD